jgi:hypothetical protein
MIRPGARGEEEDVEITDEGVRIGCCSTAPPPPSSDLLSRALARCGGGEGSRRRMGKRGFYFFRGVWHYRALLLTV